MARDSTGTLHCTMLRVTVPAMLSLLAMRARFRGSCTPSGTLCQRALPRPASAMMYTIWTCLPGLLACVPLQQHDAQLPPLLGMPHSYYARVRMP